MSVLDWNKDKVRTAKARVFRQKRYRKIVQASIREKRLILKYMTKADAKTKLIAALKEKGILRAV